MTNLTGFLFEIFYRQAYAAIMDAGMKSGDIMDVATKAVDLAIEHSRITEDAINSGH